MTEPRRRAGRRTTDPLIADHALTSALVDLAREVGELGAGQRAIVEGLGHLRGDVNGLAVRVDARLLEHGGRLTALETRHTLEDGAAGERRKWVGYGQTAVRFVGAKGWRVLVALAAPAAALYGVSQLEGQR